MTHLKGCFSIASATAWPIPLQCELIGPGHRGSKPLAVNACGIAEGAVYFQGRTVQVEKGHIDNWQHEPRANGAYPP
jgi:hypothetical protein